MRDLIDYIDTQIKGCIPDAKCNGIAHLVEDDNSEGYPATLAANSEAIYPDDRFIINYYHRILPTSLNDDDELSFGRSKTKVNNQPIRTVVFVRIDEDLNRIDDFINSLPDTFSVSDDYKFSRVGPEVSLDRNSDAVWNEEYGESYRDRYVKIWNIYAIEWQLQYSKCNVCV